MIMIVMKNTIIRMKVVSCIETSVAFLKPEGSFPGKVCSSFVILHVRKVALYFSTKLEVS